MKFEELLAFWKMKNMVHKESWILSDRILDSKDRNELCMAQVRDIPRNGEKHAQIIYRYTKTDGVKHDFELVYADILYTGFASTPGTDQIYVKNGTVENLELEFTSKHPWSASL